MDSFFSLYFFKLYFTLFCSHGWDIWLHGFVKSFSVIFPFFHCYCHCYLVVMEKHSFNFAYTVSSCLPKHMLVCRLATLNEWINGRMSIQLKYGSKPEASFTAGVDDICWWRGCGAVKERRTVSRSGILINVISTCCW